MSLADRQRLLELAPELCEAAVIPSRTLKEARASVEYTQAAVQTTLGGERLSPDTLFFDNVTLGQYIDLPDDRRAQLWDTWASPDLADSSDRIQATGG